MCGRFVLFTTAETLIDAARKLPVPGADRLAAPEGTPGPRYNLAPTQIVPVVHVAERGEQEKSGAGDEGELVLEPARWGLVPVWKKDETGPTLFNARAETVAEKPSFRAAFKRRRCLIPMDGYYEWEGKGKPHFVHREGGELMWAAGLWDTGLDKVSCTIITTDSAEPIDWLHHRMPRFLASSEMEAWLTAEPDLARDLLHPTPEEPRRTFVTRPADPAVGSVRNDYPALLDEQ